MEMGDSAAKVMSLKHVDGSCGHQHAICVPLTLLFNWISGFQTPPLFCCIFVLCFCIYRKHLQHPLNSHRHSGLNFL